ncbi:hypothetical protein QQF64_008740 [Cirrhinus molitorella]|uniref:Uncharacterized protein n=2 Tax=Cirrhinus molitorella TaxID=172907 RepID=A0ABR3MB41_9TELE|nr:hypothetical protein Q8A67_018196 [Cirrhinus molitorella]
MDEEEMILCTHCNKEVVKANYELHKPHCERFLCICPDCDETVPRDQLEEHKAEQHTEVKCKMCKKKMERRHLSDHEKDECTERPEICEFCQLEHPLSNLKVHKVSCGSRTERCSDCGQYVKLMDQLDHPQICSTTTPKQSNNLEEIMVQCVNCLKYIDSDSLEEHRLLCNQPLRYADDDDDDSEDEDENPNHGNDNTADASDFSFSSLKKTKGAKYIDMDLDKISTCPLCHLALPAKTLVWHEKKCELHKHLSMP